MAILPFGPWEPDKDSLGGASTDTVINVLPLADGYGPFKSPSPFSAVLANPCRGMFYARRTDGTVTIFAGTVDTLYRLNNTTFAWISIGTFSALPNSFNWSFAQFGSNVIIVQPNIVPQVYSLATDTIGALGGSPPQASYVSVVGRSVVLTGLTGAPFRIAWSVPDTITTWTGVGAGSQDFADGGITRGVAGGEYGLVMQDTSVRRMIFTPGQQSTFAFQKLSEDKGILAPYSLIKAGENIFWLAAQGFQQATPTGVPIPIGNAKVDRTFFGELDQSALQLVIGAADPTGPRVFFAFKVQGGPVNRFSKIYCYDYALQRWSPIFLIGEYIGSLARPGLTLEGLDSISGSIDALPFSLDDVALSALPALTMFDNSNLLSGFTGANLEAVLDTPDRAPDMGKRVRVQGLRPHTDATTCFGSVGIKKNANTSITYSTEQPINSDGICPANVSTRLARGRIRMPLTATWTKAVGIEPRFREEGRQ